MSVGRDGQRGLRRIGLAPIALLVALTAASMAAPAQFTTDNLKRLLTVPDRLEKAVVEMPRDEEIRVGREFTAELLAHMPLVSDARVQRYVNEIGMWLAMQTERADLPWRFGVTDTTTIGAFATPGGHVLITRGLVAMLQDEHQLAGVLAHEIAHVLRKHHLSAVMRDAQTSLAADVAGGAAGFTDGLVGGLSSLLGGGRQRSGGAGAGSQVAAQVGEQLLRTGMELYGKGLSRNDELEADAFGLVIAARAGYEPSGLAGALFTLDALDPATPAYELMFSTHPSTRERLDALASLLDGPAGQYTGSATDPTRFEDFRRRLQR